MERKKIVVDLQQIDLLEQKIVKATELIRSLRREREAEKTRVAGLEEELGRVRLEAAASDEERRSLNETVAQVEALREERQAIRGRVSRMLDMMAAIDETAVESRQDN
ncbi:MAG: cell division protein ZapB [Candidatus Polarisedimenticolia bacterium]